MKAANQLQLKVPSLLTASLAIFSLLLITVFTVGCSDKSLSTHSPDDQSTYAEATTLNTNEQTDSKFSSLAASAGPSEATYRATFSGDISGGPEQRTKKTQPSSRQIWIDQPGMTLNLAYFQTALAGGGSCFSSGDFIVSLRVITEKKKTPSLAKGQFFFNATGSDGVTEIKYGITTHGTITDPNNWPPSVGTQNTVVMTDWEMKTEGAGKNKKISCTGKGTFDTGVTILFERID